jgi:uncharacterized protein YaeQ
MDRLEGGQGKDDDPTVGSTSDEDIGDWIELQLTNERRVSLKQRQKLSANNINGE